MTPNLKDLQARLKEAAEDAGTWHRRKLMRQAADAITALLARIEKLEGVLRDQREFLGKVQGVALGLAMSGDNHPSPDMALMDLFNDAQQHDAVIRAALSEGAGQ